MNSENPAAGSSWQFARRAESTEGRFASVGSVRGITRLPRTFLDSNILLYCDDSANSAKQVRAVELVLEHQRQKTGVVSLQVLQEYFVNATRKLGVDAALARQKVEIYTRFHVVEPTISDVLAAIDLHRLHGFSYWDALIIHCTKQAGCRELLSEDMQRGQAINGVRIVNPFI